jgi:hypothetical protein
LIGGEFRQKQGGKGNGKHFDELVKEIMNKRTQRFTWTSSSKKNSHLYNPPPSAKSHKGERKAWRFPK